MNLFTDDINRFIIYRGKIREASTFRFEIRQFIIHDMRNDRCKYLGILQKRNDLDLEVKEIPASESKKRLHEICSSTE